MVTIEQRQENNVRPLFTYGPVIIWVLIDAMILIAVLRGAEMPNVSWVGFAMANLIAAAFFTKTVGGMVGTVLGLIARVIDKLVKATAIFAFWAAIVLAIGYIGDMLLSSGLAIAILLGAWIIAYAIFATAKTKS